MRPDRSTPVSPLLLVAHGSRDPRAARSTRALARAVGAARPGVRVRIAFLDFEAPRLATALVRQADLGYRGVTVVPLLLTAAYHGRVDVPGEIEKVRASGLPIDVALAEVLGPVIGSPPDAPALDLMVSALGRRLSGAVPAGVDGIVLAAAGTRDTQALAAVDVVAQALGAAWGVPCRSGYASGAGSGTASAVAALRAQGARRIAVAGYFLAPGLLYDRAVGDAMAAGAVGAAPPLGDAAQVARLVLRRADAARQPEPAMAR
jgi:sirohydrochlorin ferrochelatase